MKNPLNYVLLHLLNFKVNCQIVSGSLMGQVEVDSLSPRVLENLAIGPHICCIYPPCILFPGLVAEVPGFRRIQGVRSTVVHST